MDAENAHEVWIDFASKYNLELKDTEQHIAFTTKRQIYSAIETTENFVIYYKFIIYEFNAIEAANIFRIAIPADLETNLFISRPNILLRIVQGKKVTILPDTFTLDINIQNEIGRIYRNFKDLTIKLTRIEVNTDDQIENDTTILELKTKYLPVNIKQVEQLRELCIKIFSELHSN